MSRYKVIANPSAGGEAGERAIPQIERLLTRHGLDFDVVRTQRRWHAAELAREAVMAGCDVIVAAGGDGTANEVINGLMEARQAGYHSVVLGVLGVGRGNDFAHGVGVPHDLELACRVLAEGHRRMIDVSLIPHFLKGTQATQEPITTGQAAHISITAVEGALPAQTDGEILCIDGQHLEIELLPRQIEVLYQPPRDVP